MTKHVCGLSMQKKNTEVSVQQQQQQNNQTKQKQEATTCTLQIRTRHETQKEIGKERKKEPHSLNAT